MIRTFDQCGRIGLLYYHAVNDDCLKLNSKLKWIYMEEQYKLWIDKKKRKSKQELMLYFFELFTRGNWIELAINDFW